MGLTEFEEAPMITAGQSCGEIVEEAGVEGRLSLNEFLVVPLLAVNRDSGDPRLTQEMIPGEQAFLPEAPFCRGADTREDHKS